MTVRGFRTRAELRLRLPRSRSTRITPTGATKHYGGPRLGIGLALSEHHRCEETWRNWQAFHMGRGPKYGEVQGRGWADLAYTLGYCQHGYVLAGRGVGVRTAANGTNDGNQRHYAVTFIGGEGDVPSQDALDALDEAYRILRDADAGREERSHSDWKQTACPGHHLRAYRVGSRGTRPTDPPEQPTTRPLTGDPTMRIIVDGKHQYTWDGGESYPVWIRSQAVLSAMSKAWAKVPVPVVEFTAAEFAAWLREHGASLTVGHGGLRIPSDVLTGPAADAFRKALTASLTEQLPKPGQLEAAVRAGLGTGLADVEAVVAALVAQLDDQGGMSAEEVEQAVRRALADGLVTVDITVPERAS